MKMPDPFGSEEDRAMYTGMDLETMNEIALLQAKIECEMGLAYAKKSRSLSFWRNRLAQIESALKRKAPSA